MNTARHHRWRWLTGLLIVGGMQRLAPWARAEDPAWFRLNGLPEPRVGLEVDGSQETTRINGAKSEYDSLYITPTAGLHATGSIYHPNLLFFDVDGELGYGWNRMTTTSPGYNQTVDEADRLHRYLAQIYLLQEKTYNASFFAAEDHTYRDYGSFQTYTVDSSRYGGNAGWHTDSLNLTADFGVRDETDTGLSDTSEVKETYLNFLGINKRQTGETTLNARWDHFDDRLDASGTTSTLNESVGASDAETFGSRQQITASTGASFGHAEYGAGHTDTVNAHENVNATHSPTLDSFLLVNFNRSELHPATDTSVQGSTGIRHQLYESLTSTFDVHGNYQDDEGGSGTSTSDLYGVGVAENYQKKLQSWGRLSVGLNGILDHQDENSSDGPLTTIDEPHQVYLITSPQYRPVYLNRPLVTSILSVTANGQALNSGTDYELVQSGQLTEVRLITPAGSHLQSLLGTSDNLAILVTYDSASQNNASYESYTGGAQIRLDIQGGFGIYGRLNWVDNDAPPSVLAQTLTDIVAGADYTWSWFRTGAEYEDYDSNFSKYDAWRFFQNASFVLDQRSTLALNLNETFYHYANNPDQQLYTFTARYNMQLWSSLSCYVQGGSSWQEIDGSDQLDGAAQTGFSWSRGKLNVRAGYECNVQDIRTGGVSQQERDKNRVFAYLRRTF